MERGINEQIGLSELFRGVVLDALGGKMGFAVCLCACVPLAQTEVTLQSEIYRDLRF